MIQLDHNSLAGLGVSSIRLPLMGICALFLIFGLSGAGFVPIFGGFFILFSLIISCYITVKQKSYLSITRTVKNNRTFERSLVEAEYTLTNHSNGSFLFSFIEDSFPPAGSGLQQQIISFNTPLFAGNKYQVQTHYLCNNRRGKYQIGPLKLRVLDNFAFVSVSEKNYHLEDFFLYPRPAVLSSLPLLSHAAQFSIGTLPANRIGPGQDCYGIRQYVPGDNIRHVHWPATARMNRYMIKELEEIGSARISIFFDLSIDALSGLGHHTTAEYAIKIVASIAKHAIDEGHQLQVIAQGDELLYHPLGSGIWHLTPLLQQLSQIRPMGEVPLPVLIRHYLDLIPDNSTAIFVIPKDHIDLAAYEEILFLLNGKHVNINLILIDHQTFLPLYELNDQRQNETDKALPISNQIRTFRVKKGDDLGIALSLPVFE